MSRLRTRIMVALVFGLITLGQAYPYSYAWAQGQHAECGCNQAGRKCIHGCDLKKAPRQDHSEHAHHSMDSQSSEPKVVVTADEEQDLWVSPDCARQTRRQILSFQLDPFLPSAAPLAFQPTQWSSLLPQPEFVSLFHMVPESPPPKFIKS